MTTIVNTPNNGESGSGFWAGLIVVIVLLILFFVYGLPAIRGTGGGDTNTDAPSANIDVNLPGGNGGNAGGSGGDTGGGTDTGGQQ